MNLKSESTTPVFGKNSIFREKFSLSSSKPLISSYRPRNFSDSNEILKKSKELSSIHRYLLSAKPKRFRSTERNSDKAIDTNDIWEKEETSEVLKPKFRENIGINNAEKISETFFKEIEMKDNSRNFQGFRLNPRKHRRRTRIFEGNNNSETFEIRNFESFIRHKSSRESICKYDLSSIQIKNTFGFKRF